MKNNWLGVLVVSVLGLLSSGCATMFNSGAQTVAVNAWESEKGEAVAARVVVDAPSSTFTAVTPFQMSTYPSSFRDVTLRLDDPCYEKLEQTVDTHVAPVYYLNILNIPVYGIGFGIDFLTGSMFNFEPRVTLPVQRLSQDGECSSRGASVTSPPTEVGRVVRRPMKWNVGVSSGLVGAGGSHSFPILSGGFDFNYFLLPRMALGMKLSSANGALTDYWLSGSIDGYQRSALVTARYFLQDYSGFYVGLASGLRTLEVSYRSSYSLDKFGGFSSPTIYTARRDYVPLLLQAGWHSAGRMSIGVDLAAPISRLGLGNPRPVSEANTLKEITSPEARRRALNAYHEFQQPLELHFRVAIAF